MIFVVGNSRSGTTMMGRILGKNAAIFTFKHEIHFFGQIFEPSDKLITYEVALNYLNKLFRILKSGYFAKDDLAAYNDKSKALLDKAASENNLYNPYQLYELYINSVTTEHNKLIGCDQTPRNLYYLKEILSNYPDALVINIVRDPRSVLLSQKNKWKRRFLGAKNIPYAEAFRSWANFHVITISKLWNSSIKAYEGFKNEPRVLCIQYEALLSSPKETIKNICNFLKVEYSQEMINIPVVGSSARVDKNAVGIDNSRKESWKEGGLNAAEIHICENLTQQNLLKFGYELSDKASSPVSEVMQYISFPFKLGLSIFLNLARNKNIIGSIKRRL